MSKHTPGPWRAERTPASAYWDWTVMAPSGKGRIMQIGIDTDNTEADARLIAAAPDLLAIAQMVANLGEYRELIDAMANALRPHERAAFVKLFREDARAAIAKATEAA